MQTTTITLAQVRYAVADLVAEVASLDPADCRELPIVDGTDICDGYHRLAGMVRWANESGLDLASVRVTCATSDDADLLAAAANNEDKIAQRRAIAKIYA